MKKQLYRLLILPVFLLTVLLVNAQSSSVDSVATEAAKPIALSDIATTLDSDFKTISAYQEKLIRDAEIIRIDTVLDTAIVFLSKIYEDLNSEKSEISVRRLENIDKEWKGYRKQLNGWMSYIASESGELEGYMGEIGGLKEKWSLTKTSAEEKEISEELVSRIDVMLDSLNKVEKQIKDEIADVFLVSDEVRKSLSIIEDALKLVKEEKGKQAALLFGFDSTPLWKMGRDTTEKKPITEMFTQNVEENARVIQIFIANNSTKVFYHAVWIVVLIFLFYILKRRYSTFIVSDEEELEAAPVIISNPLSSALIIGLISTIFFYESRPFAIDELLILVLLVPLLSILPKILGLRLKVFIGVIIAIYVIDELQFIIAGEALINRVLLLLETFILLFVFGSIVNRKGYLNNLGKKKLWEAVTKVSPWVIVVLGISIILNILGNVRLSRLLSGGILDMMMVTLLFYVSALIVNNVIRILFRSKYYKSLNITSAFDHRNEKRLTGLVNFFVILLWMRAFLRTFNLYEGFVDIWNAFLAVKWEVGQVIISVEGIVLFILVLIVTFILARFIKSLLTEKLFAGSRIPRGLPSAFSMLIRYMIILFGIYIALSAAGIDLGRFGLLAGALGVGLGFGLQNVIGNFVAGLIIAFERPIHVGDTVEIGLLMGVVSEIGVRSSKVRTYSGSEVIVPNSNLLSNEVINWTLSDQKRRLEIMVRTSISANPRDVIEILLKQASSHVNTLKDPAPMALFEGYGESSLDFKLLFWVYFETSLSTKSEVGLNVYDALKEKGIEIPMPHQRFIMDKGSGEINPVS